MNAQSRLSKSLSKNKAGNGRSHELLATQFPSTLFESFHSLYRDYFSFSFVSQLPYRYYHGVLRHKSGAKSPGGLRKSQTSAPSSPKQTYSLTLGPIRYILLCVCDRIPCCLVFRSISLHFIREEPVKKSKSKLGGLFGKKKKVAGGSASSGRSEKGGKNKDDAEASDEEDPDDFYFSLDSAGRK